MFIIRGMIATTTSPNPFRIPMLIHIQAVDTRIATIMGKLLTGTRNHPIQPERMALRIYRLQPVTAHFVT